MMRIVFFSLFVNVVDDLDGGLAGGRVKVCQRLIEQAGYPRHRSTPLPARCAVSARRKARKVRSSATSPYPPSSPPAPRAHASRLRNAVIFHGKGNILPHGEPHKLPVGILQHRADDLGKLENIQVAGFAALDLEAALDVPLVVERDQPVQAVPQGAFAAAAGTDDEDLLTGVDFQVDIMQRRLQPANNTEMKSGRTR